MAHNPQRPHRNNQPGPRPALNFNAHGWRTWREAYDENNNGVNFRMEARADKGISFSSENGCFVNGNAQRFQLSVSIEIVHTAAFVLVNGEPQRIASMQLVFCGVNSGTPAREVEIYQNSKDGARARRRPVQLTDLPAGQVTKVTVPNLLFSRFTSNFPRLGTAPHPDQEYFRIHVRLTAVTEDGESHILYSMASASVIVKEERRAMSHKLHPPISFSRYFEDSWLQTHDEQQQLMTPYNIFIAANLGFEHAEEAGCYATNNSEHFQITVHIDNDNQLPAVFVCENGNLKRIAKTMLKICGIKEDNHADEVDVRQR
ncbi:hypothetical protein PMAYCL1PPCAC_31252, partial [Pristionchus mayeri]